MKLLANAEAIFKDMENQYSRCITMVYEKKYFQAGLYVYTITKDEAVHLLEVLKCYLMSIGKLLEESEVMLDA